MIQTSSLPVVRRAFTLIEVLTVVGIIALVAALLLPAINGAREKGRRVACASHLRQIGTAIALYAADNSRLVPYATTNVLAAAGVFDRSNRSFGLLSNYLNQSAAIFRCPSDTRKLASPVTNFSAFITITNACSYSHARTMTWGQGFENYIVSIDRVGTSTNGFDLLNPTTGAVGATWTNGNHNQAGNILFGDGRVMTHPQLPVGITNGPVELLPTYYSPILGWVQPTNVFILTVQNPL
ncbi:MAG: hypothetical protein PCFJNLEI_00242 [Verrucomicrobiae bacterium]|nr:hypothetical protein [Verrucomicrobiae bacterium]